MPNWNKVISAPLFIYTARQTALLVFHKIVFAIYVKPKNIKSRPTNAMYAISETKYQNINKRRKYELR